MKRFKPDSAQKRSLMVVVVLDAPEIDNINEASLYQHNLEQNSSLKCFIKFAVLLFKK